MARRGQPRAESPRELRQKKLFWRTAGVMAFALAVLALLYYWGVRQHGESPGDEDHHHERAAHGGRIVSVGEDDQYHVEVVLEQAGTLKLHTLGEDVTRVVEVDSQIVRARVRPEGASSATEVELMPMPQPSDRQGRTSRFAVTIPKELWGKKLTVVIPGITIGGIQLSFEFKTPGFTHDGDGRGNEQDQEKLYRTPGGKYSVADIHANGDQAPPQKFQGFQARHDAGVRLGDRICPVSRTRANPECTWIVAGKTYQFCCPPCIDEFVRRAKGEPQGIQEPEDYVLK